MTVEKFFEIFLKELSVTPTLHNYYKFLNDEKSFEFRKAYFISRLQYIADHIKVDDAKIWDCGCGYGTTALFLAMNGHKVYGTTLEFYFDEINSRKEFWSKYGDVNNFTVDYEDVFDNKLPNDKFDYIILQDTLHHIEPMEKSLEIFFKTLKFDGKMIVVEVNGSNIIENIKYIKQRGGFKRIIKIYDEKLQKEILLGNENIRSWKKWKKSFLKVGFKSFEDIKYIRYYLPFSYKGRNAEDMIAKENIKVTNAFLRKYFFFGLCFIAEKN